MILTRNISVNPNRKHLSAYDVKQMNLYQECVFKTHSAGKDYVAVSMHHPGSGYADRQVIQKKSMTPERVKVIQDSLFTRFSVEHSLGQHTVSRKGRSEYVEDKHVYVC